MANKIIYQADQAIMPWKNGQGSTAQIEIIPNEASFPEGDFLWRLSSATVGAAGPFSQFPGCDRWLVVLSGQGLSINGKAWGPFTPWHFQGEEIIQAEPLKDAVVDLGLIYRRDLVQAKMKVLQLASTQTHNIALESGASAYIYCVNGNARCDDGFALSRSDTYFTDNAKITIKSQASQSVVVLIEVRES